MVGNHALGLPSLIFTRISHKILIKVTALKLGRLIKDFEWITVEVILKNSTRVMALVE